MIVVVVVLLVVGSVTFALVIDFFMRREGGLNCMKKNFSSANVAVSHDLASLLSGGATQVFHLF